MNKLLISDFSCKLFVSSLQQQCSEQKAETERDQEALCTQPHETRFEGLTLPTFRGRYEQKRRTKTLGVRSSHTAGERRFFTPIKYRFRFGEGVCVPRPIISQMMWARASRVLISSHI